MAVLMMMLVVWVVTMLRMMMGALMRSTVTMTLE